ncbi:MAG: cystathionine beta-lyase [Armatimonadota bacterium]
MSRILNDIMEGVGNSPMVRLNRIGKEFDVEILAKLEMFEPGGSIKDRIAVRMVDEAARAGRIRPGDTLIEATSGNTGIGLALACAVRGYQLIICMPKKMSAEKQNTMEALGATIVRTRTSAKHDDPDSNFKIAERLQREIPNAHILDQWSNTDNIDAHYHGTAVEILDQTDGKLDYFVAGAGTGGTLTGVARRLRDEGVAVEIVGADPIGSILGGGEGGTPYKVEGIGYDFIPDNLDKSLIHRWIKTDDASAFRLARRLIREEGILAGGSSGSAMQAALEVAKSAPSGSRIVVVLPDGIRNYMSKMMDPVWLKKNGLAGSL